MTQQGMGTRRQAQKEETRNRLLDAALDAYGRLGILAVKTSDVAQAAGVSHGTVFAHFPTQVDLIHAVLERFGTLMCQRVHELAGDKAGMRELLQAHLQGIAEFEGFYTRLVIEGRMLPPGARHTYVGIQSAISFHMGQVAEVERANGQLLDCPTHLLFNTWVGLVHHYLLNNDLFAPGESIIARYGEELMAHFLRLVETRPATLESRKEE